MKGHILWIFMPFLAFCVAKELTTPESSAESKNVARVVGSHTAKEGEAPYQISLQSVDGEFMCGGAIIGDRWILTAAHCVFGYNHTKLRISTGTNKWKEPRAVYQLDNYIVHCSFDNTKLFYTNDIALIQVNETIKYDQYTQPISLASKPLKAGDQVTLTGWGWTELGGDLPDELQIINLNYINHAECVAAFNSTTDPIVDVGHLCTLTREGEGSCHGDSGGPLIADGVLVGAVNFGVPCARGKPDVYANISFYYDWIQCVMADPKKCNCASADY